jgi:predicted Zn-ribbon and HTH transcriptional regulator
MYRRDYIDLLRNRPVSLHQLASLLGSDAREVEQDLRHLFKSLRNTPCQALIQPARCRKCGFIFQRDKLHKPGKCPACRSTWIREPLISIEEAP